MTGNIVANNKARASSIARHSAQCGICQHPQRKDIEDQYLKYVPLATIARMFGLNYQYINKHMELFALDFKRSKNTASLLDHAIYTNKEKFEDLTETGLLRALEIRAKVRGEFVERFQIDDLRNMDTNTLKEVVFEELRGLGIDEAEFTRITEPPELVKEPTPEETYKELVDSAPTEIKEAIIEPPKPKKRRGRPMKRGYSYVNGKRVRGGIRSLTDPPVSEGR